jgi:hypothetical protein
MAINSITGEYFRESSADNKYKYVEIDGKIRRVSKEREVEEIAEINKHQERYARATEQAMRMERDEQLNWVPEYKKWNPLVKGLTVAEYALAFAEAFPNSPAAERYARSHPNSTFARDYNARNPRGYVPDNFIHPNNS